MPLVMVDGEGWQILLGNNRDAYPSIGPVQAVITDPPYGTEVHHKDKVGRRANGEVDSVPVPFEALTTSDMAGIANFCEEKCNGWALIFCQHEQVSAWRYILEDRTLNRIRYAVPMVWIKPDAKPNFRGHGPGVGHETIMSYWCGTEKRRWNGGGQCGVFYHNRSRREGDRHPTEKPVALMKELVRLFTNPGDTIFDPFMGAGSTGVAALELGRKFIGVEQTEPYFLEAKQRLEQASRPTLLSSVPTASKIPTLFGDATFGSTGTRKRLRREAKEKGL